MSATALHPLSFPLHGSRLIEASAGTGKTWTIAALYLRLILGHGANSSSAQHAFARPLMPPDILVMTFTRAATRELSGRIRERLVQAVACFRGEAQALAQADDFLHALLADYPSPAERELAAWRLALAAECMDDAAIFTIDAWCQRVLREHALDSGSLLEETLEADESQRRREALQDYWRQQCYPLQGDSLQWLLGQWPHLHALARDIDPLARADLGTSMGSAEDDAEGDTPDEAQDLALTQAIPRWLAAQQQRLHALAAGWAQQADAYLDWIEAQLTEHKAAWDGRKLQLKRCAGWLATLKAWAQQPHPDLAEALAKGAERLTPAGLDEARKSDADRLTPPPQAQALHDLLAALAQLPQPASQLRWHAATQVRQRLQWLKTQAGTFGFDDMLHRLDAALRGPQGATLRQRLLQQYPVALLDEFQDTSPLQYRLFEQLYRPQDNHPDSALLLIGDPKQSIYGFRGADIYSYLQARAATAGRHYVLGTNHRSTQALVEAVNHWFGQAEQQQPGGAFLFQSASGNPLPFLPVAARGRDDTLLAQGQRLPALELLWHSDPEEQPLNADTLQRHYAQACAERIVQWLNDPSMGFAQPDGSFQRLRPRDIAVLVRKGREASAVRQQLQRRGVASVYLSDRESVFASPQAQDLLYWLKAVAEPRNARHARAALATRLLALPLAELQRLALDDEAFDQHTELLRQLHHIWQRQGVLAMLRASLHRLALPARWLAQPGGERQLTNYLHLAELLQNASAQLEGEQALIRWLATHLQNPSQDAEAQTVRLESDADLVQVVTIHKSKGLEYPIVMLPFASDFSPRERRNTPFVRQPDGRLRLDLDDADLAQADQERLREDLRLFYVALTRPRHLLWLGLGALRKGRSSQCVNERSASGYLLAGAEARLDAPGWWQQAQTLADGCPAIRLSRLHLPDSASPLAAPEQERPLHTPPPYQAHFDKHWGVASFSALVRAMQPQPDSLADPLLRERPADDEADPDQPAPSAALLPPHPASGQPVWHRFKRGAVVGNFIHDQLEWLAAEDFQLDAERLQRLHRRCARAGYAEQAEDVQDWLAAVLQHRLPVLEARLPEVQAHLSELEFWLPLAQLPAAQVDALCRQHLLPGQERPALPQRQLHGMLMGFADLVCQHQGRYWVLDYKSNHLGPDASAYTPPALAQAMLAHRYDVQAALYLLALHRLLQTRLGQHYQPAEHLGGALYFFLRGLDGSAGAIHHLAAPLALLDALQALIDTPKEPL